jgi:agmatinase
MPSPSNLKLNVVQGEFYAVPYDLGTVRRRGARDGPAAIFSKIQEMRPRSLRPAVEKGHLIEQYAGNIEVDNFSGETSQTNIEAAVNSILAGGQAPLLVGGDHSITIAAIKAFSSAYGPDNFGIIHFDAHLDTFPGLPNFRNHHGAVFRNLIEDNCLRGKNLYQFGLRGFVENEAMPFQQEHGITMVTASEFVKAGCDVSRFIPDLEFPYYVSFDIDVVDPVYAPGTGSPVPGGLNSMQAIDAIQSLRRVKVIGADFVEVAPAFDHNQVTVALMAAIMTEFWNSVSLYALP